MKVRSREEGPILYNTKMTVNTFFRGWLDYAWMVRLSGQLRDDSLRHPTGCAQGILAKSNTKGGLSMWVVLTEDTAVKPFLKQDKEISSSSSDSNNYCYIYSII